MPGFPVPRLVVPQTGFAFGSLEEQRPADGGEFLVEVGRHFSQVVALGRPGGKPQADSSGMNGLEILIDGRLSYRAWQPVIGTGVVMRLRRSPALAGCPVRRARDDRGPSRPT